MGQTTLIGVLGVFAVAACWSLAGLLFRVAPRGGPARLLAWLLIIEGLALFTAGFPEYALGIGDEVYEAMPWLGIVSGVSHFLADAGMLAFYPPFLAAALATPLTRPFSRRGPRIGLVLVAFLVWVGAIVPMALFGSGVGIGVIYVSVMLLFTYGFIASIDAWRRAEPGIAKTRAGVFAIAFGLRDLCWGFVYGASFWMTATGTFSPETALFWQVKVVYALGSLLAVPLIAYGILSAHLFDIDLKIRWTLKQSTYAASVLVITSVVSEGIEMLVAAELGDAWGLVAAAVAVLFLKPLQAFAERVVSALMPNTRNTAEYRASRKLLVYEEAVAEAHLDGGISDKERSLLVRLRDSLGISEGDAAAIERKIVTATAPAA